MSYRLGMYKILQSGSSHKLPRKLALILISPDYSLADFMALQFGRHDFRMKLSFKGD